MIKSIERLTPAGMRYVSHGYEAFFIAFEGYGLKLFDELSHAERSHRRQERAAFCGLAPAILSEVKTFQFDEAMTKILNDKCKWNFAHTMYGYQTEIVDVNLAWRGIQYEMEELRLKLLEIFEFISDLGRGNVGMKEDRLVLVDFGDCSFDQYYD
jgi:hypothetical protein